MQVRTTEDAYAVYLDHAGDNAITPAHAEQTPYDARLGGWLFENVNGPLALVRGDGTVIDAVHDAESGDWVIIPD